MANYKYLRGASINDPSRVIFDIPDAPTIGTATNVGTGRAYNNGSATVAISGNAVTGGPTTGYTVTSSPGSFSASTSSSTVTVTGLQSGTAYTFTAQATNSSGTGSASSSSNSITATTVPQAPTIGTATGGTSGVVSVPFTAGATGGSAITGYTVTSSSGRTATGSSSPISITELVAGSNTYTVTATNANGTSAASSASNSVTSSFISVTGGTLSSDSTYFYRAFTGTDNLVVSGGTITADILTIAGGGGGQGSYYYSNSPQNYVNGGGGGAGGLVYQASQSLTAGTYSCSVGAGISGYPGGSSIATGNDSQFGALTVAKGGGGGGYGYRATATAMAGGSGGGGSYSYYDGTLYNDNR